MAVTIKASDLKYTYSKKAIKGDNNRLRGKPDSTLFNREEEYEVIYLLEKVLETLDTKTQKNLHILEDMIKNDLPGNVRKRQDVHDWLVREFTWGVTFA